MYITYNGITNTDVGAELVEIDIPARAERENETITIPGRVSPLLRIYPQRDAYSITVTLRILYKEDLSTVYNWLSGSGRLVFSDTPDRYYNVSACARISSKRIGAANTIREVKIKLTCSPFAYAIANDPVELTSSPAQLQTVGTMYSEPLIELTGAGDVSLTVNGVTLEIKDVSGTVFIDVHTCQVYKLEYGAKTSILSATTGWIEQMVLVPDTEAVNVISWTGDVSSVKITKNERWQ